MTHYFNFLDSEYVLYCLQTCVYKQFDCWKPDIPLFLLNIELVEPPLLVGQSLLLRVCSVSIMTLIESNKALFWDCFLFPCIQEVDASSSDYFVIFILQWSHFPPLTASQRPEIAKPEIKCNNIYFMKIVCTLLYVVNMLNA